MPWQDLGEALVWFIISSVVAGVGMLAALIGLSLSHFRGTRSGRTPLVLAFFTTITAILLWLIVVFFDTPCSMIYGVTNSLLAFMGFTFYLSRYDRS